MINSYFTSDNVKNINFLKANELIDTKIAKYINYFLKECKMGSRLIKLRMVT